MRSLHEQKWNIIYYERRVAYKKGHKNTFVPDKYKEDPPLGNWVLTQRTRYNKRTAARIDQLNSIGFVWDMLAAKWTERSEQLVDYKKEKNSTRVPDLYTADQQLANWESEHNGHSTRQRVCISPQRRNSSSIRLVLFGVYRMHVGRKYTTDLLRTRSKITICVFQYHTRLIDNSQYGSLNNGYITIQIVHNLRQIVLIDSTKSVLFGN